MQVAQQRPVAEAAGEDVGDQGSRALRPASRARRRRARRAAPPSTPARPGRSAQGRSARGSRSSAAAPTCGCRPARRCRPGSRRGRRRAAPARGRRRGWRPCARASARDAWPAGKVSAVHDRLQCTYRNVVVLLSNRCCVKFSRRSASCRRSSFSPGAAGVSAARSPRPPSRPGTSSSRPPATPPAWPTWRTATAARSSRSPSTSPTPRPPRRRSPREPRRSAGSTSWSTTPATPTSRRSRTSRSTDFRAQVDANLFGVVNVTKAALPVLRAQGGGHIIQVSSIGGRLATPGLSAYQAAKWAVGGFSEVLAREVGPLGIKVTVLEPGGMQTDWAGSSMRVPPISEPYQPTVGAMAAVHDELGSDDFARRPGQGGPGRPRGRRDGRAAAAADPGQRGLRLRDGGRPGASRVRRRLARPHRLHRPRRRHGRAARPARAARG